MKKIYFIILIALSFLVFIALTIYKNKGYNDEWKSKISFSGNIQDVVHLKNEKGSFLKVNDNWYEFSYNRIFEQQSFIGFKIEKKINEEGIWIEKSKGSDSFLFYWSLGNVVRDHRKYNMIMQKSRVND